MPGVTNYAKGVPILPYGPETRYYQCLRETTWTTEFRRSVSDSKMEVKPDPMKGEGEERVRNGVYPVSDDGRACWGEEKPRRSFGKVASCRQSMI